MTTIPTIIVTGHLLVADRDAYLADCREVVALARAAEGCVDFAVSPDLLDDRRVNILECWADERSLADFRGAGTPAEQAAAILVARVVEHDVAASRPL
jgi:quinol monooxygenase YgiN